LTLTLTSPCQGEGLALLFNQQKGVAIHGLRIVGQHLDRITILADRGEDVYSHGFRRWSRQFGVLALCAHAGTIVTDTTTVHEQKEGLLITGQKDGSL